VVRNYTLDLSGAYLHDAKGLDRLNNNSPSHAEESTELQLHNTEATRSAAETSANLDQASDLQVGRSA
jgi:hypothetical protein